MTALLVQILAALAVSILKTIQAREDLKQTAFDKISQEDVAHAMEALQWKVRAAGRPGGGADLRVRDPGEPILPGHDPDPPGESR